VFVVVCDAGGNVKSQTCLADTARPGQRQKSCVLQEARQGCKFLLAAHEAAKRQARRRRAQTANGDAHRTSPAGREQALPIIITQAQGVGQPQYGVAVGCTAHAALQI
jgi:hypothetical protein